MECVEGGLKSSFLGVAGDDFLAGNGVAGDDFFVDGLLDFSDDGDFEEENENTQNPNDYYNTTTTNNNNNNNNNNEKPFSNNDEIIAGFSLPENDLCLPADDVADLEWVSHFVDDSFSGGYSLTCTAVGGGGGGGKLPEKKPETEPENNVTVVKKPSFTSPVHTKARSKRTRTGGRVWSLGSSPFTDSSTSSSSSSSCTSNPWLFFHDSNQTAESIFGKKPVKRQKKKNPSPVAAEPAGSGPHPPRRCSHCLVQKTPQWRAGPLGAKTLCNACGVRYKSGRLLPEYRPACSPTFSSEVHSNNHRKVLEMRQKKEAGNGPGLTHPVQSF